MRACAVIALACLVNPVALAESSTCGASSWIFEPGTYTHDPNTGARVAQYVRKPAVEPLDDPRQVTSSYRRTRTSLRGADGSIDTSYQVQSWGNGRGGIDAEWERFHNAWQNSYLSGSQYRGSGYGPGYYPQPYPYGGAPAYGYGPQPGYGPPPGYGYGVPPGNVPRPPAHRGPRRGRGEQ